MNNPDATFEYWTLMFSYLDTFKAGTVKLGIKELFDKEQIGIKEPFAIYYLSRAWVSTGAAGAWHLAEILNITSGTSGFWGS